MAETYPFCGRCGAERVSEDDKFCTVCGQAAQPAATPFPTGGRSVEASSYSLSFFRSPSSRANWTLIFLGVGVLVTIASIVSTIMEIDLIRRVVNREFITDAELLSNDNRQNVIYYLSLAVFLLTVVTFCRWIYRASDNLDSLRVEGRRFSPGWSVGWWFIPIMALFRPYQVVNEIWKGSDPTTSLEATSAWTKVRPSAILGWWWAAWVVSTVICWQPAKVGHFC